MEQIKATQIEVWAAQQNSQGGTMSIMSTLGGKVVEGYDQELASYNAELLAINAEKTEAMNDKGVVSGIVSAATQTINLGVDAQGKLTESGEGKTPGVLIRASQKGELEALAQKYGIQISVEKYKNGYFLSGSNSDLLKDKIESRLLDLNSTSELKIIRFQSLIDARKQSMLMLSNMLSSDNQTKMAIIQNLKG